MAVIDTRTGPTSAGLTLRQQGEFPFGVGLPHGGLAKFGHENDRRAGDRLPLIGDLSIRFGHKRPSSATSLAEQSAAQ